MSQQHTAGKFGYIPQDQRPEVIVSANTSQTRLDELIAAGFQPVVSEQLSRALGQIPTVPKIVADPEHAGQVMYTGALPQAALSISSGGSIGSPPSILEAPPDWTNIRGRFDRYALNPLVDYYRARLPGAEFGGPAPSMFLHGDLPIVTGSGLDPSVLRWVPFWARHEAAYSESKGTVYSLIEGAETPSLGMLSTVGRAGWEDYSGRVQSWVNTMPPPPALTEEDYAQFFPDDSTA